MEGRGSTGRGSCTHESTSGQTGDGVWRARQTKRTPSCRERADGTYGAGTPGANSDGEQRSGAIARDGRMVTDGFARTGEVKRRRPKRPCGASCVPTGGPDGDVDGTAHRAGCDDGDTCGADHVPAGDGRDPGRRRSPVNGFFGQGKRGTDGACPGQYYGGWVAGKFENGTRAGFGACGVVAGRWRAGSRLGGNCAGIGDGGPGVGSPR